MPQRQVRGGGAAGERQAMRNARILRELLLKRIHHRPQRRNVVGGKSLLYERLFTPAHVRWGEEYAGCIIHFRLFRLFRS